ncbi:hypothetical protein AB6W78_10205 [Pasteurella multocida]|uniref:hypothetical protein n=1 Tax=Pasteurella multocida TaxID=747 RepID=UPI0003531783|nr:hypothetical protein [Pasteurella multocida]AWW56560.1 hypothetical protein DIS05_08670 [Pasteurella multocida]EPE63911.1 sulfate transport protein CysZ [Pasteurella multocida P1933]MCL7838015.1 hypothetical protein [Pasteurella multocida]MCL7843484.1 hypothetical protein [Pasteurella multocida]MDX3887933.1 hypothetical protein [Pasteurella multocida]
MKTKRLNKGNHLAYKFLEQAQKAVMYCNAMGLTVTEIDFSRIKPTLRVMHNKVTEQMLAEDKAIIFKHGSDDKAIRYCEGQFMAEGIRTIFRIEDIDIQSKGKPTETKH